MKINRMIDPIFVDYKRLLDNGFITKDCEPIRCTFCGSKDLRYDNHYKEEWYVVAYDSICNNCGKKLGHWEYGVWEFD